MTKKYSVAALTICNLQFANGNFYIIIINYMMMNCLIGDLAKEFLRHQKIKRGTFVSFFKLFCKGKATISNL